MSKKTLFQLPEGAVLRGSTVTDLLSCQGCEWGSDSGELWEELVIEATNTKEGTNVLRILGYRPVRDSM